MLGGLVFYQGEQIQQDDLDLRAITADFGYELDFAPSTITIGAARRRAAMLMRVCRDMLGSVSLVCGDDPSPLIQM